MEKQRQLKTLLEEQEQALQRELDKRKHLEIRDEKIRQRIRDDSTELKQLEHKLKTAYLNKDRSLQQEEAKALEEAKKVTLFVCSQTLHNLIFDKLAWPFVTLFLPLHSPFCREKICGCWNR